MSSDRRHPHRWGYADTRLELDGRSVRMTGDRYPLSGVTMPHLIPFVERVLGLPFDASARAPEIAPAVPAARIDPALMAALERIVPADRRSLDATDRLARSHGQLSVGEVDRALYGGRFARVVDLVVEPADEREVQAIIAAAVEHGACLVPYGGGTNVSGALQCPEHEARPIVAIDMRRMNRVLSVDAANRCALVEAGITGAALEQALGALGYTSGHIPDSLEFSTLGGWISTNASGMKKNRYGNVEDIVIEATLVTPSGAIETKRPAARTSAGMQPLSLVFGSEGNLGVITKALIAIHPKPDACRYQSLMFRSFADGVAFLEAVRRDDALPASLRLVNNHEFQFGQALRRSSHGAARVTRALQRTWLTRVRGFDADAIAACTMVMEGTRRQVDAELRALRRLAKPFHGVWAGAENGRRGYSLTFAIAYVRDFFSQFGILGESFETSVPWDRIHDVCGAVERALVSACASRGVAGRPFLSYRVTQTYHAGVCIYFTMAFSGAGLADPGAVFADIERQLRQVILDRGGSVSHHHGVGKIRRAFLPQVHSPAGLEAIRAVKRSVDPGNVFGIANGACGREPAR